MYTNPNPNQKEDPKQIIGSITSEALHGFTKPGMYVFDFPTGGGKTYQQGHCIANYYPNHFAHIAYIAPQNKLIDGMYAEICKHFGKENCIIKTKDVVVVKSNIESFYTSLDNGSLLNLVEKLSKLVADVASMPKIKELSNNDEIIQSQTNPLPKLEKCLQKINENATTADSLNKSYQKQDLEKLGHNSRMIELESSIRFELRMFFSHYAKAVRIETGKEITAKKVLQKCEELSAAYPEVRVPYAKVILLTCSKCVYGIDPILSQKTDIIEIWPSRGKKSKKSKKNLFILDESDACAVAFRKAIIEKHIEDHGISIYDTYLNLCQTLDLANQVSTRAINRYDMQGKCFNAKEQQDKGWISLIKKPEPPRNILLPEGTIKHFGTLKGIFQAEPLFNLQLGTGKDAKYYLAFNDLELDWTLVSSKDMSYQEMREKYTFAMPLQAFAGMIYRKTNGLKSMYGNIALDLLEHLRNKFDNDQKNFINGDVDIDFVNYPSFRNAIHSIFARYSAIGEKELELLIEAYLKNPRNVTLPDGTKMPVYHVCYQGISMTELRLDESDYLRRVYLNSYNVPSTPEKILHQLLDKGHTIILSSATAATPSLPSNFNLDYFRKVRFEGVHCIKARTHRAFEQALNGLYPEGYSIKCQMVNTTYWRGNDITKWRLPDDIRTCFSQQAIADGNADMWFAVTRDRLSLQAENSNEVQYYLNRWMLYIKAYRYFLDSDMHSFIYFQNPTGLKENDYNQILTLSCLIDGTYINQPNPQLIKNNVIPANWTNDTIVVTNKEEIVLRDMLLPLSKDAETRRFLVASYMSFSAGVNLQYDYADGTPVIEGLTWGEPGKRHKKDIDGCFLSNPTGFLTIDRNGTPTEIRQSCMHAALIITMLNEDGYLSDAETHHLLNEVFVSKELIVGVQQYKTLAPMRSAFALRTMQQAVGRLTRTKTKSPTCHILVDQAAVHHFDYCNDLSATKEWRQLISEMQQISSSLRTVHEDVTDRLLVQKANNCQKLLRRINSVALSYNNMFQSAGSSSYIETARELGEDSVADNVIRHQEMIRSFKQTILRHPTLVDFDDLNQEERIPLEITDCYGTWDFSPESGYTYSCTEEDGILHVVSATKTGALHRTFSPSSVRLDILMRNKEIKEYFIANQYATRWNEGKYILHPYAFDFYIGEIGEQAFLALATRYLSEFKFSPLESSDYEWADFVIDDEYGEHLLTIDVKNMAHGHIDNERDLPTELKRRMKESQLGCRLLVVNIVEIPRTSDIHEIAGLIRSDGSIIIENIEILRRYCHLANNNHTNNYEE